METIRMRNGRDLDPESCEGILCEHLQSVSMLAIFPIQDWLSIDGELRRADFMSERVNDPSNPHHHWRYRLHFNLETLSAGSVLTEKVRNLLVRYGRQSL
jgi:4-alpha-glucanotransferase